MFLNSTNIVYYLLEKGLVSAEQVVDGDFMVTEAPRRNRNFKVMKRDRSGLFVKQVQRWEQQSIATVQLEAHCYRLTNEDKSFVALRDIVPRFHCYDERRAVLVTELLPGGETLAEYHFRNGGFPDEVAVQLGQAFGRYHRQVKSSSAPSSGPEFPRRAPWVLSFHNATPQMAQSMSGANYQLLEMLKRYPEFGKTLDRLAGEWRQESLIHGDIKWDNCVLVPNGANGSVKLKLVDWELADWGDPCWDVAAIFSAFIVFWIQSLPLTPGEDTARAVQATQFPIEKMQPAIHAFWEAYLKEMQLDAVAARDVLRRSVLFCGARTIQTAYEYVQMIPQMSNLSLYMLQVSMNILLQPEAATSELLGLSTQ